VCLCVCVCARARACVCACVCVCTAKTAKGNDEQHPEQRDARTTFHVGEDVCSDEHMLCSLPPSGRHHAPPQRGLGSMKYTFSWGGGHWDEIYGGLNGGLNTRRARSEGDRLYHSPGRSVEYRNNTCLPNTADTPMGLQTLL
jgi:hypothetical protein